jgi:formylglycine-generating enzyme required for sulfatase activity
MFNIEKYKRMHVFIKVLLFTVLLVGCGVAEKDKMSRDKMVLIAGGILDMGGDNKQASPNEYPKHKVSVDSFWMDETEVTNAQFEQFVTATQYITVAERPIEWETMKKELAPNTPKPPDSFFLPGALVFHATPQPVRLNDASLWWRWILGADWRHPEGGESNIKDRMDHPVVQVAWEDAVAYAEWAGKRLPTEAEWEWAARGGKKNTIYPWGNEDVNKGDPKANFWQGVFPFTNQLKDGFYSSAPVKSFPPNGYGLYDMAGNVWEWCADWLDFAYYQKAESRKPNNLGPDRPYNPTMPLLKEKVMRGGSFLCSDNYCSGYRNARRMGSGTDTGLNHTGFRCVRTHQ